MAKKDPRVKYVETQAKTNSFMGRMAKKAPEEWPSAFRETVELAVARGE